MWRTHKHKLQNKERKKLKLEKNYNNKKQKKN